MNLDATLDLEVPQNLTDRRVSDFIKSLAGLGLGIHDTEAVFKKRRKITARNIAVFVDRRGQDGTAVHTIPSWVVGATAHKRDAKWRASNYHAYFG
jgi:hypothetical protein